MEQNFDRYLLFASDPTQYEYFLTLYLIQRRDPLSDMIGLKKFQDDRNVQTNNYLFCHALRSVRF